MHRSLSSTLRKLYSCENLAYDDVSAKKVHGDGAYIVCGFHGSTCHLEPDMCRVLLARDLKSKHEIVGFSTVFHGSNVGCR